tara:strand:+ start:7637 stop:8908 length:1272 start_codon:yes stop_codon:yes gene_type:complete
MAIQEPAGFAGAAPDPGAMPHETATPGTHPDVPVASGTAAAEVDNWGTVHVETTAEKDPKPVSETPAGSPGTAPSWTLGSPRMSADETQMLADQASNGLLRGDALKIHITHIPTGRDVKFDGWVTSFSDGYTSQWNEEMVYGRMDPLATYQSTRRSISIAFDIPNDSKEHAIQNMANVRKLIQFMYPTYMGGGLSQQNVLKAGPILGLRWINLIAGHGPKGSNEKLIGYINGALNYAPDMGVGGFLAGELERGSNSDKKGALKNYFPKYLSLSFSFSVLHTHLGGWARTSPTAGTYIFGGNENIEAGFPNANVRPDPRAVPVPAPVQPPQTDPDAVVASTGEANENLTSGAEAVQTDAQQELTEEERQQQQFDAQQNQVSTNLIGGGDPNAMSDAPKTPYEVEVEEPLKKEVDAAQRNSGVTQ